jgi:crotonyl-CoA carboxylase/reductase
MTEQVDIGSLPPLGDVPEQMWASVVRQERFGKPADAFVVETLPVPQPGPGEALVAVMAAGVNYNNVWAARGVPVDVIASRQRGGDTHDFHIGGSDASGIVYAVGDGVEGVEIGAEVVVHPGYWDPTDPWIAAGKDPMIAPSAKIWGYDTNFGSFAQFCIVQAHQLLPKAPRLSWAEAAAPTLVGTTAYRMLFGWEGNVMKADDVVLVWGGSGGLGSQAIQLAVATGARAVAVVSDDTRGAYCMGLGATGYVLRGQFDHWGIPPHWDDAPGQKVWTGGARAFGKAFWDALGERRNPDLVFEHPGEATVPTSVFVAEAGGMIVICAGTTGYSATVDLRYHWTRQKRLQGSHGTNDDQARAYNELVMAGRIDPCLGKLYGFDDIGRAHADMADGIDVLGNRVVLVGATDAEQGRS